MMRSTRILHQTVDYASVVYYAGLSFFALFEMFLGGDSLSLYVSAPLFYALAVFGIMSLIIDLVALAGSFVISRKVLIPYGGRWTIGVISFILCYVIYLYINPIQRPQLFDTPSLFFLFFPIVEVLVRSIFYKPSKVAEDEAFVERLGYVARSFPAGGISILVILTGGMILGVLLAIPLVEDPLFLVTWIIIFSFIFTMPIEYMNRGIGESGVQKSQLLYPSHWVKILRRGMQSKRPHHRIWNPWFSMVAGVLLFIGFYFSVSLIFQPNPRVRAVAALFVLTYAILALWRWFESQEQQTIVSGV